MQKYFNFRFILIISAAVIATPCVGHKFDQGRRRPTALKCVQCFISSLICLEKSIQRQLPSVVILINMTLIIESHGTCFFQRIPAINRAQLLDDAFRHARYEHIPAPIRGQCYVFYFMIFPPFQELQLVGYHALIII